MHKVVFIIFSLIALSLAASVSFAETVSDVGKATYISGDVYVVRGEERIPLAEGDGVLAADTVITGSRGRVALQMHDNSKIHIGRSSRVSLSNYAVKEKTLVSGAFNVLWGKVRFFVAKLSGDSSFNVTTKTAVLGVRGTEFVVVVPMPEGVEDPTSIELSPNLPDLITTVYGIEGLVEGVSLKGERVLIGPGVKVEFSVDNKVVLTFDQEPKNLPSIGVPDIAPVEPDVPSPADIPVPTEPVIQEPVIQQLRNLTIG